MRQPARPDQEGDSCSTLETPSDPAPDKPALEAARGFHHALGRTGCRPTAEGERKSVAGPHVRHHARRDLGVAGEVVLDLDAASNIELTVDEGVDVGFGDGVSHRRLPRRGGSGGPLRRGGQGSAAERASFSSNARNAARARPKRDIRVPTGMPSAFAASCRSLDRHEVKNGALLVG